MAQRIRCRHCDFVNGPGWLDCFRCRRHLRDSPTIEVQASHAVSWGQSDERAAGRPGPEVECRSCGASTPERYAFCVRCGRSPGSAPVGHRQCPSCEAWMPRAHAFCERCGDPMTATGAESGWRPDGCPGCWADAPRKAEHCGECGAPLPADLPARRELLREVCGRRITGDYRNAERVPELHPARPEVVLTEDDHAVWMSLDSSTDGAADLEIAVSETGDARAAPPSGSLIRLARWVRKRLGREELAELALRTRVTEALAADERLLAIELAPGALRIKVALRDLPRARRVEAWAELAGELFGATPSA